MRLVNKNTCMLFVKRHTLSKAWKLKPVILALKRLRQEGQHEFKTNLHYELEDKSGQGENSI